MLIRPIYTEKSLKDAKMGNYTFKVSLDMTKKQIAGKVAQIFGVKVLHVRTSKIGPEKGRNARGKSFSFPKSKKAIVTLVEGGKIDIFEVSKK